MAELKCILDIMQDYIQIHEAGINKGPNKLQIEIDPKKIKDHSIRKEMYHKIYKKIQDDDQYLVSKYSDTHKDNPYFWRIKDIHKLVQDFIKSQQERTTIDSNRTINEFINANYSEVRVKSNVIINLKVIDEQKRKEEKVLELLNNIL